MPEKSGGRSANRTKVFVVVTWAFVNNHLDEEATFYLEKFRWKITLSNTI